MANKMQKKPRKHKKQQRVDQQVGGVGVEGCREVKQEYGKHSKDLLPKDQTKSTTAK